MLKRILSGITVAAVTVSCLVCGAVAVSAEASDVYAEDFSAAAFTAGEKIAGVENGALVTPPHVNGATWKWTSDNTSMTSTANKAEFTAVSDGGNMAAKYNHTKKNESGSTNNERYGVVFDQALEGDISISFKLKKSSGEPVVYAYVGDDTATKENAAKHTTWGISLFKLIQNQTNVLGAYYPTTAIRSDVPGSDKGDKNFAHSLSDSEWSTYTIAINTYTGKTAFSCDGTQAELDACENGIGKKVKSFYFHIERHSESNSAFLIDDITVSQNSVEKLTLHEVTGESENAVSSGTLPTEFSGLGAAWTVKWSGNGVTENGTVTHEQTEQITNLTAAFYNGETKVGEKTFENITITAFDPLAAIDFDAIKGGNTERGSITGDLELPTTIQNGGDSYDITWESSNPDVIAATGKVIRTAFDAPVILTAAYGSAKKSFSLNVAAERAEVYFEENMTTAAVPATFNKWSAATEELWTTQAANSITDEIPYVAEDPKDSANKVLALKRVTTRSATNIQTGLYRKVGTYEGAADVQYVSLDIYPTDTTPRTEIRVVDAAGERIAGICYMYKKGLAAPYLTAFGNGSTANFEDPQPANNVLSKNAWSNITIKLDYKSGYAETYLNGNYVGKYALNSENKNVGYIYLGIERNATNPETGEVFSAEKPGYVYFDNLTVRTAAGEENGAYAVISYEGGTLKLRKIVNTAEETMVVAAAYSGQNLADAKVKLLGSGKTKPSIITIEDFAVTGDLVKIFNWDAETLTPIGNGVLKQ